MPPYEFVNSIQQISNSFFHPNDADNSSNWFVCSNRCKLRQGSSPDEAKASGSTPPLAKKKKNVARSRRIPYRIGQNRGQIRASTRQLPRRSRPWLRGGFGGGGGISTAFYSPGDQRWEGKLGFGNRGGVPLFDPTFSPN